MEEPTSSNFVCRLIDISLLHSIFYSEFGSCNLIVQIFHLGKVVTAFKTLDPQDKPVHSPCMQNTGDYSTDVCPVVIKELDHFLTWFFHLDTLVLHGPVRSRNQVSPHHMKHTIKGSQETSNFQQDIG